MDFLDNETWLNRKLLCTMPQNKESSASTLSSIIARKRAVRARERA